MTLSAQPTVPSEMRRLSQGKYMRHVADFIFEVLFTSD